MDYLKKKEMLNHFQDGIDQIRAVQLAEVAICLLTKLDGYALEHINKVDSGLLERVYLRSKEAEEPKEDIQ